MAKKKETPEVTPKEPKAFVSKSEVKRVKVQKNVVKKEFNSIGEELIQVD